jgi:hypothetical protein
MAWRDILVAWWYRHFGETHLARTVSQHYTIDGNRGAEVRVRKDGKYYYVPLEHVGGTDFKVIPSRIALYQSKEGAESAAVNSPWFLRGERPTL